MVNNKQLTPEEIKAIKAKKQAIIESSNIVKK